VKTVLIVDDDPFIVDLLTRQLEKKGLRIISSTDPETAYTMAEQQKPDLILSTQHIPLVLLTASDRMSDVEEAFLAGAQAYLLKPLDWDTAWPKIETLLSAA